MGAYWIPSSRCVVAACPAPIVSVWSKCTGRYIQPTLTLDFCRHETKPWLYHVRLGSLCTRQTIVGDWLWLRSHCKYCLEVYVNRSFVKSKWRLLSWIIESLVTTYATAILITFSCLFYISTSTPSTLLDNLVAKADRYDSVSPRFSRSKCLEPVVIFHTSSYCDRSGSIQCSRHETPSERVA